MIKSAATENCSIFFFPRIVNGNSHEENSLKAWSFQISSRTSTAMEAPHKYSEPTSELTPRLAENCSKLLIIWKRWTFPLRKKALHLSELLFKANMKLLSCSEISKNASMNSCFVIQLFNVFYYHSHCFRIHNELVSENPVMTNVKSVVIAASICIDVGVYEIIALKKYRAF